MFAYYFQIWMAQELADIIACLDDEIDELREHEGIICERFCQLLDLEGLSVPTCYSEFLALLSNERKRLDLEINDCGIKGILDSRLRAAPGALLRGMPKIIQEVCGRALGSSIVYFCDEFELLLEDQQRYIHTLIREISGEVSIKIGARRYGLKTFETLNDGEINKQGAEYELVEMDGWSSESKYYQFATDLICRRLAIKNLISLQQLSDGNSDAIAEGYFEDAPDGEYSSDRTSFVQISDKEEPLYFHDLRRQLQEAGLKDIQSAVVELLRCSQYPLLEKVGILAFYKRWTRDADLESVARDICKERDKFLQGEFEKNNTFKSYIGHFKYDLLAQIFRRYSRRQVYSGFRLLAGLTGGLPRNLLVLMRHVFEIAEFREEFPFYVVGSKSITVTTQRMAAEKAAQWFFDDALIKGRFGNLVQRSVRNLCNLFRAIRFSDKPVESSLCTFAVDLLSLSEEAKQVIQLAEQYSLLLRKEKVIKTGILRGCWKSINLAPCLLHYGIFR